MKTATITVGLTALALGGALLYPQAVLAYRGDPNTNGPYYSQERHDAMEKAFESKDYNAWKNLMGSRGRVTQVVTKDNFAKFAQAHELAEQGKLDEAVKIRTELGLGLRNGSGKSMGKNRNR